MKIRTYEPTDEAQVIALWNLTFPDEPEWNESKALIERKLNIQPELFLVAVKEEKIIGTTIAGFDGVRGWVHKVATHPDFLRQGVARELMSAAEEGLRKLGCTKLNIQVRTGNDGAVSTYESMGYVIEDRVSLGKHL